MSIVLDSSMTLAWCFADERTKHTMAVLERVAEDGAVVPSLWRLEVANGLQMALRRKRITEAFRDDTLRDLEALSITVDHETDAHAWQETLQLAAAHQLTLYDAAYLELAKRTGLPLASLDEALLAAAKKFGLQRDG